MLPRVLWYCYELTRNQWLSPDDLRKLQERRMRAILKHAYDNVPLHYRKFNSIGIKPDDIKILEDLKRIPFTTKQEIRDGIPNESIARGYESNDLVRMSTSGTTGGPMPVFYDKKFWDYYVANLYFLLPMMRGSAPWDTNVLIQYNRPEVAPVHGSSDRIDEKKQKSRGREALGPSVSIFKRWSKTVFIAYSADEIIPDIVKYQPKRISANPSYLRLLAEAIADKGIRDMCPKSISSFGEVLDEPSRKFLESSFGCEVFNGYGANESGIIASECSKKEGLHIFADFVILEVVRDGAPVGPGEKGEIVVTGLLNYAMPLIRYRIGDIGILSDEQCSCGRGFPLLKSVEGRGVDCFTLPNGRIVTPKQIQSVIQATAGVSRFQIVQESVNKVTLELMRNESDPEVHLNELMTGCRGVLGDDIEIEVNISNRDNLKAKFRPVISKLTVSAEPRWIKPRV